jgi:hypothetical protein
MKEPTQNTWTKLEHIAREVKADLRRRGIVIPVKETDGSIIVDRYRIVKEISGFYTVTDIKNKPVIQNINLPQTAALLANELALGKWINNEILTQDRNFGYLSFEETLTKLHAHRSLKKKDIDRAELLFTKGNIACEKSKKIKNEIMSRFEKLRRLR